MTTRTELLMEKALLWVIGVSLTALITWSTWATALGIKHETRLSIVETRTDNIDHSLTEIKEGQKEILTELRKKADKREL